MSPFSIRFAVTVIYGIARVTYCDTVRPAPPPETDDNDFSPVASRNYGNTADSSNNYYTTYTGYPSYGSSAPGTFSDPYNPSEQTYFMGGTDKKKPYSQPTYPTYPTFYPSPGYYGSPECNEQMMNGVIGEVLATGGVGNAGLLKSVVAAVTAGILAKIPIILAIKALIVKLILLPLGFIVLSLPFILPIMLLFSPIWTKLKEAFLGTTTPAPTVMVMMAGNDTKTSSTRKSRTINYGRDMFVALIESDRCFEKLACLLGSRDADSPYIKPVSWLLKFLQTFRFVQNNVEIRSMLKRYRDAYLQGVTVSRKWSSTSNDTEAETVDACPDRTYPCNTPNLYARPEFVRFSRYFV